MRRWRMLLVASLAAPAILGGCASMGTLSSARDAFQGAKKAGAETKAPYEYYAAEAYLGLADEENNEGDPSAAAEYAGTARKYAEQAASKAGGGAR